MKVKSGKGEFLWVDLMADIVVNVVERMACIITIEHMTEREMGWCLYCQIGKTSTLGSYHPEYRDMYYPINYGYVEKKWIVAPEGTTFAKEEIRE